MNLVVGVYGPDLGVRWLNCEYVEWGSILIQAFESRQNRLGCDGTKQSFIYRNRHTISPYIVLSCKFASNLIQSLFITSVHNVDLVILGRAQVLRQVALPAHVEK